MPKSLIYVPGLAMPQLVVKQAKTAQEFNAKIESEFRGDSYMTDMVAVIQNKGAIPADCRQSLRWIQIPKAPPPRPTHRRTPALSSLPDPRRPGARKAFDMLGLPSSNVLSLEAGVSAKPMKMSVGVTLTPCTAPEYMAQPMPSSAKTKALASLASGDTLYIVGHSNALGGALTYKCPALNHVVKTRTTSGCEGWQHAEKRHIDPVTLGSLLINEGLPPGLAFDISLVACFSGGLDNTELQTVQCFAQRLAGTLGGRGYRCRVYGATGLTSSRDEVQIARGAVKQPDGTILLNPNSTETLKDAPGQPFYRRFFRFFG